MKEIFAHHISDKGLVVKLKELSNLYIKKIKLESKQKTWTDILLKRTHRW